IELRGTPSQYPDYVNINAEISDFEFTPLKFPYDDGPGLIINTYGTNSHTGSNLYAFDLCTGIKCPEEGDTVGTTVIAPTDLTYLAGPYNDFNADNIESSLDMHIFEVDNNGSLKLCMMFGHFDLWIKY